MKVFKNAYFCAVTVSGIRRYSRPLKPSNFIEAVIPVFYRLLDKRDRAFPMAFFVYPLTNIDFLSRKLKKSLF